MKHQKVTPYGKQGSKKEQVTDMFDRIAFRYDFLNRLLSAGIDVQWRKSLVRAATGSAPKALLDIATGTGDVAIMLANAAAEAKITGLDISSNMLEIARQKTRKRDLSDRIHYVLGDSENLPFEDNTYDAITVAFGVRNFENTLLGLEECYRVLKTGGSLSVLEFSQPTSTPFRQLYHFYFKNILPLVGRITSRDPRAYHYLFESAQSFPSGKDFASLLTAAGFGSASFKPLTFGICTLYTGIK